MKIKVLLALKLSIKCRHVKTISSVFNLAGVSWFSRVHWSTFIILYGEQAIIELELEAHGEEYHSKEICAICIWKAFSRKLAPVSSTGNTKMYGLLEGNSAV